MIKKQKISFVLFSQFEETKIYECILTFCINIWL